MRAPNRYNRYAYELVHKSNPTVQVKIDGRWVPARPEGYFSLRNRLRCAWEVFTGKADALYWPGQER